MSAGHSKPRRGPLSDLGVALGFLTVFPVPARVWGGSAEYGRCFSWFPAVGIALGAAMAGAGLVFSLALPVGVSAALVVALGVFLTGGLHFDGLMDSCDGLFSAKSSEERLAVMRDSRVGAFGVLGALSVMLVKYSAFAAVLDLPPIHLAAFLLFVPVVGRWAMVFAVVAFPYHHHGDTLGSTFVRGAEARELVFASVSMGFVLVGIAVYLGSAAPFFALFAGMLATLAVAGFALSRLPGFTGDVYGAVCEVSEAAALVALVWWMA